MGNLVGLIAAFIYSLGLWLSLNINRPLSSIWHALARYGRALSYGIYLFHNTAPVLIQDLGWKLSATSLTLVSILLTWLMADLAHRFIEVPYRSYGRSLSERY